MGADFSNGGQVHGDCLTCPFHGWKFNSVDGKVSEIPYTAKPGIIYVNETITIF